MLELITAALAGAAFTQEIAAADNTGLDTGASKLFIALHPSAFIDDEQFDRRVNDFLQYLDINAAPFLYPGARGWQAQAINRVQGVPIHQEIVQQLARAGLILE
ncbi:MAG TPA: Ldh family oxidoreductase, partial [Cellvibrionaceae bacterium]|nr:Ldh family oxidoreductase [Cellvibrionaceae bacterium]